MEQIAKGCTTGVFGMSIYSDTGLPKTCVEKCVAVDAQTLFDMTSPRHAHGAAAAPQGHCMPLATAPVTFSEGFVFGWRAL